MGEQKKKKKVNLSHIQLLTLIAADQKRPAPPSLPSLLPSSSLLHVINGPSVMDDDGGGVAGTTGQGRTLPPERPGMARPHAARLITQPQLGALIDGLHQAKPPNGGVPSAPWAGPSISSPSHWGRITVLSHLVGAPQI